MPPTPAFMIHGNCDPVRTVVLSGPVTVIKFIVPAHGPFSGAAPVVKSSPGLGGLE